MKQETTASEAMTNRVETLIEKITVSSLSAIVSAT